MKNIAVLLSGSGFMDGSEIHEASSILMNLHKHKFNFQCFSFDKN